MFDRVDVLFDQLERVRFALVRAKGRGVDIGSRLHEANNLATAAYAWSVLPMEQRREIHDRIARLVAECDELLAPAQ